MFSKKADALYSSVPSHGNNPLSTPYTSKPRQEWKSSGIPTNVYYFRDPQVLFALLQQCSTISAQVTGHQHSFSVVTVILTLMLQIALSYRSSAGFT